MTLVKFCGMTRERDVHAACELGVDALGFVMWPGSPRFVAADRVAALVKQMPEQVTPVGVFVTPSADDVQAAVDAGIRIIQLHGYTNPGTLEPWNLRTLEPSVWLAASVDIDMSELPADMTIVLDAHDPVRHGGTGRVIDWSLAATVAAVRRVVLAGGLTATNVGDAIRQVRPFGVDVASGIEATPGIKDAEAMAAFVAGAREADRL
jgi:phosphoribosylanthranilate isomerase